MIMKKIAFSIQLLLFTGVVIAQTYPEPEFTNEVCYLKKDSSYKVIRLEKESSKMQTKNGFGSSETSYSIDGEKSGMRINNGNNLSFIISSGSPGTTSSPKSDSAMRANGIDPSTIQQMGSMMDPANTITLYKTEPGKRERKIYLQKSGGGFLPGAHKQHSSDKYTFSVRKIRPGYLELVIDKPLPKGEYAFTMMNMMGGGAMDGSILLFAFAIDN
jgi:uncharacterized protein YxeA